MAETKYAGEYIVEECKLYTVGGLELDLKDLLTSVIIYEDIFKNSITGSIAFIDTNNITANVSIVGQEKLKLILMTPNADDDTSREMSVNFSDMPLYVYKIGSKIQLNDNTQSFVLNFTTRELIRNNQVRCSQSYEGEPSAEIVKKILRDPLLLDSKKEFYYEETTNLFKLVAPNQRPFDFINNISKRCLSKEYNFSPTFLFYETLRGYWFRTIDSMMDRKNPRMVYSEQTPNEQDADIISKMSNILEYEVTGSTDTILNRRAGMYNSNLLLLDVYNKTYSHHEYKYIDEFENDIHVDEYNTYASQKKPVLSEALDDYGNTMSDYPDSVVHVQTIERLPEYGLFNPAFGGEPYQYTGTDKWLQRRRSRFTVLDNAISIRIKVPGSTAMQAGDMVGIILKNKTGDETAQDPYFTGRYLVRNLRHEFKKGQGQLKHEMHLDCIRDTVAVAYPSDGIALEDGGNSLELIVPRGSASSEDIKF